MRLPLRVLGAGVAVAAALAVGAYLTVVRGGPADEGPLDRDGAGPAVATWSRPGEPVGIALSIPSDRLRDTATLISARPRDASPGIRYVDAVVIDNGLGGATPWPLSPRHVRPLAGLTVRAGEYFDVVVAITRTRVEPAWVSDWEIRYRVGDREYTSRYGYWAALCPDRSRCVEPWTPTDA